jgi:hypothetical protein
MGQVVTFESPRAVGLEEYADPPLGVGEVRLQTLYSGISAGTELTAYRGSNPYLSKRWDAERRLFVGDDVSFAYPVKGWGYEEVGRVVSWARAPKASRRATSSTGPGATGRATSSPPSGPLRGRCPRASTPPRASSPASGRSR